MSTKSKRRAAKRATKKAAWDAAQWEKVQAEFAKDVRAHQELLNHPQINARNARTCPWCERGLEFLGVANGIRRWACKCRPAPHNYWVAEFIEPHVFTVAALDNGT